MCIQSNTHRETRGLLKLNDSVINAKTAFQDIRNSDLLKDTRQHILQNKWPAQCKRCFQEESSGNISRRLRYLETYKDIVEDIYFKTNNDGSINPDDFFLCDYEIRLGNICNLKCRMCWPGESNYWFKEFKETVGNSFTIGNTKYNSKNIDWFNNSELLNQLMKKENLQHAKMLSFSGGEPLLYDDHILILEKAIEYDCAKNIQLDYATNGTISNTKLLNIWEKFKQVTVTVSVDDLYEKNEYIRYPSNWSNIEKVLLEYNIFASKPNIKIFLGTTIQIYNILSINGIKEYISKNIPNVEFVYHFLQNPKEFCITSLPNKIKKIMTPIINDSNIVTFMNSENTESYFDKFVARTEQMDKYRKNNFKQIFPELYGIINAS